MSDVLGREYARNVGKGVGNGHPCFALRATQGRHRVTRRRPTGFGAAGKKTQKRSELKQANLTTDYVDG